MTPSRIALAAAAVLALAACGKKESGEATAAGDAAAPAAATAQATGPATPPPRKPGLWKQTVSMGEFNQSTRICLDATTDQKISWWGAQASKDMCEKNEVTRGPDGSWRFTSVCDMGSGGKSTTSGVATGDFSSNYKVEATTSTVGANAPQMNGEHKMTLNAVWQGPCPADFKPGDMEMPGGMRMNLADMAGAMKGAPGR